MKAYVLHGINDLRYEDVAMPACPSGWAIVEVKAVGICSSDIPRIFTKGTYHFPTIPGHEFSGVVHSVADAKDADLVGRAVGVFPLIPCRECEQCAEGHYEMCAHYDYIGSRRDGAYAQYVAAPVWNLVPLPDGFDFVQAAMLEPLAVGLHSSKMIDFGRAKSVAVIGTGMIGISVAQFAKRFGAECTCIIGRNETKRALVESNDIEYLNSQTDSVGEFDAVVEAVGTPASIDQAINMARAGGTVVLMGNPSGDIPLSQNTYWRILRKQLTVRGTWNSSYAGREPSDWTEAVEAIAKGEVHVAGLVSHRFDYEHLMDGLQLMREHSAPYCKVMILW